MLRFFIHKNDIKINKNRLRYIYQKRLFSEFTFTNYPGMCFPVKIESIKAYYVLESRGS